MTLTRYQVMDASGHYGTYNDRMQAIMVCNRLYKEGDHFVRMFEIIDREIEWMNSTECAALRAKDYEELCNG